MVTIGEMIEQDKLLIGKWSLFSLLILPTMIKLRHCSKSPKYLFWDDNKLAKGRERLKTREQSFSHRRSDNANLIFSERLDKYFNASKHIILYVKRLLLWGISTNYEAMR